MSEPSAHVTARTDGAVRVLTITRPEKKNAFTFAMYEALARALKEADADPAVRVIVLGGAGGVFTAGNDLADFVAASGGQAGNAHAPIQLLLQLVDQQKPLLAAVDGPAIGIGTTLLLHADYVVATTRARLQLPFAALGLSPEGGSSVLLPLLAGMPRASEWLLFGEPIPVERAREAGLVNAVVEPEALDGFVLERARLLAERPPAAVAAAKRLLREPLRPQVKAAIEREWHEFVARLQSPEALAALTAFLSKRK